MRVQYSTHTPLNPVFQPFISPFYVHVADIYESPGDTPTDGYDGLKPPAYTTSGHRHFSGCLPRSLLVRKDALSLQQLLKLASPSRNPQVPGIGGE